MIKYRRYGRIGALIFCLLGLVSFLPAQKINDGSRYKDNSILATGKWIQLKVRENGIYKLTYDDIKKQGINDPSKVKIYGYGGWILPEDFTQPYVDDLPEVAVYMNKGNDGVFNSGDYLLFYGRGTIQWTYNSTKGVYEHENNPYATYGSYFMTEGDIGPKEMEILKIPASSSEPVRLIAFDDYVLHEKDSISLLNSGRELFGENFVKNSGNQSFSFSIPGITSDPGKVCLSFAAASKAMTHVELSIDGQEIISMPITAISASDYYQKAKLVTGWGNWTGEKNKSVTTTVTYTTDQSVAYLNFIVLNMKRSLQFYDVAYTFFRNKESRSNRTPVMYSIGNPPASCQVWDITQNYNTRLMETELKDNRLQFTTLSSGDTLREFAMVDLSKTFPSPEFAGTIPNQNLHALPPTDMIILTPSVYMAQAKQLAEKHQQKSGLRVAVVEEPMVFNEFSSGTPDATAYRRFMKMFYDRAANDSDEPRYLLLFGDGLFDNRHLTSDGHKRDPKYYLLTYQVRESLNELSSYGTDDYFGFLDDNEGKSIYSDQLDIGIGRFPVSTVSQAEDVVNKVIAYMENKQYGNWKSKLVFTADMAKPTDSYAEHVKHADRLATYIERNHPEYMLYKYYIDAYKLVDLNGKPTCPEAKKGMLNQLKDGCFLLNYTGHGSVTDWSAQGLLNIADVRQMSFENLPLWITATCDFGWFDGFNTSGGETAFLNKKGGAIALYTTSRVVNSLDNYNINNQLIQHLFIKKKNGKHYCLGDVLRLSKKQLGSDLNKLNFILLGDPALELNYPEWTVQLESINGNPIQGNNTITLKALDKVTLSGVIYDDSGNRANKFTGTVRASVFDSKQTIESVTSDNAGGRFSFTDYPGMIFSGNAEVKNGAFDLIFNVPLDISYSKETTGKIGLYAYDPSMGKDAVGSFLQYYLAGSNDSLEKIGFPEIAIMFLNTENFKDGDPVNETPFFFAEVRDENGINLAGSGLGHDLELRIDNKPAWTYSLNSHYEAIDITQGTVGFSIPELPEGKHQLQFRVWNILNNSTTDSLYFTVVKGYKPIIFDLRARENPARTSTFFTLIHNLPETVLDVEIGVYDLTGRTVWIHSEKGSSGYLKLYPVEWNLVNNAGNRVSPGIYIYRATIRTANSRAATQAKKIIVLKQ